MCLRRIAATPRPRRGCVSDEARRRRGGDADASPTKRGGDADVWSSASRYLSANGGMANAWTADEETCYYFNVNADALDGAVDRLAQFFIAPTLDRDAVEREVRAVDSEYRMALQDDAWRLHSVLKATADRAHPFSRFSTGTRDTLLTEAGGVDALLGELRGWNRRRYVAPAMRLAVVGRESLDALEKLVTAPGRFGDVPAGDRDVTTLAPAWSTGETSARVKVAPVRELRSVQLMFALPSKETLRAHGVDGANPEVLVSHVLGHEGEASLHSLLRERGWIDALQCGSAVSNSGGQLFELAVDLTEAGDERCEDVIDLCFEWMGVAKRGAEAQWARLNEELRLLGETRFDFSEKRGAADTAADVADALWDHPISPLAGPLVGGYDPKATRAVLDALTPENCLVFDVARRRRNLEIRGGGFLLSFQRRSKRVAVDATSASPRTSRRYERLIGPTSRG